MPEMQKWIAKDHQYFAPAGRVPFFDLVVAGGHGATLIDVDGHQYLDLLASASALNVGIQNPRVVQAIQAQAGQLIHYISGYFYHQPAINLAERLAEIAPIEGPKKVAFTTSGSEAVEGLVKFARAYTGRSRIITFNQSWHGTTLGAAGLSAIGPDMQRKIGPLIPGISHVDYPDWYHRLPGETVKAFTQRYFQQFLNLFTTSVPVEEVAAVIVEPIQGDAGIIMPPKAYLVQVAEFCRQHGILFATDEVNQGFGRSGRYWSIEHFGIQPDLMAVGKSLASGMPLAAVIGKAEIMNSLQSPAIATTTAANPICCAAALATIDEIEAQQLVQKSADLGQYARDCWLKLQQQLPQIGDVRMVGLNGGIELVQDPQTKLPNPELASGVITECFQHGVLMITGRSHILRFQPPLVITKTELQQAFKVIEQAFTTTLAKEHNH